MNFFCIYSYFIMIFLELFCISLLTLSWVQISHFSSIKKKSTLIFTISNLFSPLAFSRYENKWKDFKINKPLSGLQVCRLIISLSESVHKISQLCLLLTAEIVSRNTSRPEEFIQELEALSDKGFGLIICPPFPRSFRSSNPVGNATSYIFKVLFTS